MRLNKLDDILFPIEEHPVFARVRGPRDYTDIPILGKKAIFNTVAKRVVGVVGRGYRVVTNRQALDWGIDCCATVFPKTKPLEWKVNTIDAPRTGSYCYIELMHHSSVLDFSVVLPSSKPEVFGPFIRITNSYNTLRALAFDIGIYRKVCKNGLITPKSVVQFKFTHSKSSMGDTIHFQVKREQLADLNKAFTGFVNTLSRFSVAKTQCAALTCQALQLRAPTTPTKRNEEDWHNLSAYIDNLIDRYVAELGENAYAVLNVITDLASAPPENGLVRRDRHGLQRLAGTWVSSFTEQCKQPDFSLDKYFEN